ncbi:MAG: DUF5050 domain-containing protein [Clostridium sp.]|nr:DUF5050 domain-containing protein [Clostridium sp.]
MITELKIILLLSAAIGTGVVLYPTGYGSYFVSESDDTSEIAPQLPDSGGQLADFVPDGWELLDSVELDFNEDGLSDYVGVLEHIRIDTEEHSDYQDYEYPRILFAIAGETAEKYRLDFQNSNLIRTAYEGGVHGDPYQPLTAEKTAFTTSAYGGSAWRWSDIYTYTYREGVWRLTLSEHTYGYHEYITDYSMDDWEKGVGIRKKRSDSWEAMQDGESTEYDVVYEVSLDEPMTLQQAGMRNSTRAADRVMDWGVEEIRVAEDVGLSENMVRLPETKGYVDYTDENCELYMFDTDSDTDVYYLAMYSWQDKVLSVPVQEETQIKSPSVYKGKIYYSANTEDGAGIYRIEPDGTGKEMIFAYHCPKDEIPWSWIYIFEISGDEIIAEVFVGGGQPDFIYRMNIDGSECKEIGRIP